MQFENGGKIFAYDVFSLVLISFRCKPVFFHPFSSFFKPSERERKRGMATGEESREKRKLEREGRGRKGKRKRRREGEGEQSTHLSRVRSWCKEYRYASIAVQAGAGVLLCLCLQVHKIPVGKGRCLVELWHFLRFTFSPVFFSLFKGLWIALATSLQRTTDRRQSPVP